jgi:hypothetical protein
MQSQNIKEDARDIINHSGDYLETFYKLTLVRLTKKISDIGSGIVNSVLIFLIGLCVLLFVSMGAAWWLGDVIKNRAGGFLLIALFYLLLVLILILMRKKIISPFIRNLFVRKMYEEKNKVIR